MSQDTVFLAENEGAIRARAYHYWEEEGRPNGRHEIHWQRAVAFVTQQLAGKPDLRLVPKVVVSAAVEDVTLIDGVGPKIETLLKGAGINKLSQLAALSTKEVEVLDAKLGLKGRSLREDWVGQAKDLIKGATPRAKIDQVKASKK